MLGDIVHNENVVKEIKAIGIKKISRLKKADNEILLIRAHGAPKSTFSKAKRLGYKIIDATCPMVKEIHRIAQNMEKKGYLIIVIGDKKHDEVRGIIGQLKNRGIVISTGEMIPLSKIKKIKKACVVSQSTQNTSKVLDVVKTLQQYIPELKFINTICKPTRIKQEEIMSMPLKNDVMLIIGSKNSANTKRLYELSKALNKRSYWINSKDEIRKEWFKSARKIGITAGASTPEETIKDVIFFLKSILS
jgi:4-hydroxy-3-methylbut-2-enyl diphosphate reductase